MNTIINKKVQQPVEYILGQSSDHVGRKCPKCGQSFEKGDKVYFIPLKGAEHSVCPKGGENNA